VFAATGFVLERVREATLFFCFVGEGVTATIDSLKSNGQYRRATSIGVTGDSGKRYCRCGGNGSTALVIRTLSGEFFTLTNVLLK
jgi:hypothetical protein